MEDRTNKQPNWLNKINNGWHNLWIDLLKLVIRHLKLENTHPNKITKFRIWLCPLLFLSIILTFYCPIILIIDLLILIAGGISDGIDGYLAKTKNKETRKGKWLDSGADKLFVFSFLFPAWLVKSAIFDFLFGWLLVLELILFSLGLLIAYKGEKWEKTNGVSLGSNQFGKWKFTAEICCGSLIFLYVVTEDEFIFWTIQLNCLIAIALASLSIYNHILSKKTPP